MPTVIGGGAQTELQRHSRPYEAIKSILLQVIAKLYLAQLWISASIGSRLARSTQLLTSDQIVL